MADNKQIVSKLTGKWLHDVSSLHEITPNTSTYTLTYGSPESKYHTTCTLTLPSDVVFKSETNLLNYKGSLTASLPSDPLLTPAASAGDVYTITFSGTLLESVVNEGDLAICVADTQAATTQNIEQISPNWNFIQGNIDASSLSTLLHVHSISLSGLTGPGGNVVPTGSVSTPTISSTPTMKSVTYSYSGSCQISKASLSLGNFVSDWQIDPNDDENIVFISSSVSYDKVVSATVTTSTTASLVLDDLNCIVSLDPIFTGNPLTPHTHNVSIYGVTGPAENPVLSSTIRYKSTNSLIVTPYSVEAFNAPLTSNTYADEGNMVFEGTLTEVGNSALKNCTTLSYIEMPDTVDTIGNEALSNCTNLASISMLSSTPPSLANNALNNVPYNCSILVPDEAVSIYKSAPNWSSRAAYIRTNKVYSMTYVSSDGLIVIPDNIDFGANLISNTYDTDKNIGTMIFDSSVTTIGGSAFSYSNNLMSIDIPNTVTTIENMAFYSCNDLTSINIPNSVTSIKYDAFGMCGLNSITIPYSVTNINIGLFTESNISIILIDSRNPVYDSRNNCNAIIVTATNTLQEGCNNTVIPDTVTCIGNSAFSWCLVISNINIPNSVVTIENYAFSSCINLLNIDIPNSVTTIGDNVFSYCQNLINCSIGSSVTNIGEYAFLECTSLTNITSLNTVPPTLGTNVLANVPENCSIYVPYESLNTYKMASGWSERASHIYPISIPIISVITYTSSNKQVITPQSSDFGANIISNTYDTTNNIGTITFDSSVTKIGHGAYLNCSNLISICIPNTVTSFKNLSFQGCTSMTSINIPTSIRSIGTSALYYCQSITSLDLPSTLNSIGYASFGACTNLSSITVDDENTVYDSRNNCNAIILTSNNKLIAGCKNTVIPNDVTTIGEAAFYCSNITIANIGNNVTSINYKAFQLCSGMTTCTIGNSVTSIGYEAFRGCTSLTSLTSMNTTPPTLGYDVFYGVPADCSIYVPAESVETYKSASGWSERADYIVAIADLPNNEIWYTTTDSNILTQYSSNAFNANIVSNTYEDCKGIILFDNDLTQCGDDAFKSYGISTNMQTMSLPDSVTLIGAFAFHYCLPLISITMNVNNMYRGAFNNCVNLRTIISKNPIPPTIDSTSIQSMYVPIDCAIYVPYESISLYQNAAKWSERKDHMFAIQDNNVIYYKSSTDDVVNPYDSSAFGDATLISNAYSNGYGIMTFNKSVTSIGLNAFLNCSLFTDISLPNSAIIIGNSAFEGCTGLSSFSIKPAVTTLGNDVFKNCTGFTKFIIPSNVTTIGAGLFNGCFNILTYEIPDTYTEIPAYTFNGCSSLSEIIIPASITSIGEYAFSSCSTVTSLEIPLDVSTIGNYAFNDCTSITVITSKNTIPPTLGTNVFNNVLSTCPIYVPTGSVDAYKVASGWSDRAAYITTQGYEYVDYILTDGYAYINSGIKAETDLTMKGKFYLTNIRDNFIVSARVGNNRFYLLNANAGDGLACNKINWSGDGACLSYECSWNLWLEVESGVTTSGSFLKFDSTDMSNSLSGSLSLDAYIYILGGHVNGGTNVAPNGCRVSYIKLYKNDVLVFDGVAVKRISDNKYGLLNSIDNQFYGNNNSSGSFSGGYFSLHHFNI